MGHYCFAHWHLLSVVVGVVCRLSGSVTLPAGGASSHRARGRSGSRRCTRASMLSPVRVTPCCNSIKTQRLWMEYIPVSQILVQTYLCVCHCIRFRWSRAKSRHVSSVYLMVIWSFTPASVTNPAADDGDFIYYEMSCRWKLICGKSRPNVGISAVEHHSFLLTVRSLRCTSGMGQSRLFRQNSGC